MLTPERKHHHNRINRSNEWRDACHNYVHAVGWQNKRGFGSYLKRCLAKARRRYARDRLRGLRGKEPTTLESEVNWRGT